MTSQEKGRSDPNHIELTRAGIFMALLISIDSLMFRIQTNARSACFRYNCVTKCEAGVTRFDCGDENAYARRYRASLVVLGSGGMWSSSALPGPASRVRAQNYYESTS